MRTNRLAIAGSMLLWAAGPAMAQPVAGSYEVKFEELATNCDPVRFTYTRGIVRIDTGKSSLRVNIDTIPQMAGVPGKSGKIAAKTPKKVATTIDGIDGKYRVSGRVDDDGVLEVVLVAEYTRRDNGRPLCTQSWNVSGVRQQADKRSTVEDATIEVPAFIPNMLTDR